MKYKNPLLVVCDLEASIAFYREVLGLRVVRDFGANVTLTGGVCLQTKESWLGFLGVNEGAMSFGGRDAELYFEEDAFDAFAARLAGMADVRYVHPVLEHRILLNHTARLDGQTPAAVINRLVREIPAQNKPLPDSLAAAKIH